MRDLPGARQRAGGQGPQGQVPQGQRLPKPVKVRRARAVRVPQGLPQEPEGAAHPPVHVGRVHPGLLQP